MPNGRTTGRCPISGEQSTFVPKKVKLVKLSLIPPLLHTNLKCKGDEVDSKLSEILSAAKFQVPIQRVKEGVYNLAGKVTIIKQFIFVQHCYSCVAFTNY